MNLLDSATTEKILDADIVNILKKVKAGQPLTQDQRKTISKSQAAAASKSEKHPDDEKLPTANSMAQVQAWIGMPVTLIKSLKEDGCQAFDSANRVKLGTLLRFFFLQYWDESEKPPDNLATWREALNRIQAQRQEILLERDKGTVLDLHEAERRAAEAESYYFAECDRAARELPTALCGMSANQIAAKLGQFFGELKVRSREKFKAVAQP